MRRGSPSASILSVNGGYWAWWVGGVSLATLAIVYWVVERRLLGVSGKITSVLEAIQNPEAERAATNMSKVSEDELAAALLAATREEFGSLADVDEPETAPQPDTKRASPRTLVVPATARLAFLLAIGAGAAIATLVRGEAWSWTWSFGESFETMVGTGPAAWLLLLGGGVMVGFGTRMCGGCTSGHGLCGTARLQSGSIAATISFFGAAVLFSMAMEWIR